MPDEKENYPAESRLLILEGQLEADRAMVQVRNYRRPNDELDQLIAWPEYTLIRSLGPTNYTASAGASRFAGFGDVFLVPAGIPLKYRSRGGPYRHLACRLDGAAFERLTRFADVCDDRLLDACRNIRMPRIDAALIRLAEEALTPSFASDILIDSLATILFVDLARYFRQGEDSRAKAKGGLAPWQLHRIESWLKDSCGPSVSVERLAELCGISASHLMRAFKQTTGRTVHSYVESVRIEKARQLLVENRLPLKAIATELGFSTASSFSFAFRRATGGTPVSFREQARGRHCHGKANKTQSSD
jgi:AraC family transcriptional regulator